MNTIHDENLIKEFKSKFGGYEFTFNNPVSLSENIMNWCLEKIDINSEHIRNKTIDECITCVEEIRGLNFEIEKTITNLNNLKNNG